MRFLLSAVHLDRRPEPEMHGSGPVKGTEFLDPPPHTHEIGLYRHGKDPGSCPVGEFYGQCGDELASLDIEYWCEGEPCDQVAAAESCLTSLEWAENPGWTSYGECAGVGDELLVDDCFEAHYAWRNLWYPWL